MRLTTSMISLGVLLSLLGSQAVAGTVLVGTEPQGATVWLDDQEVGTTPLEIGDLPNGKSFVVSVHKAGYGYYAESVEVIPGQATVLLYALEPASNIRDRLSDLAVGRLFALVILGLLALAWLPLVYTKVGGWALFGTCLCVIAAFLELTPVLFPEVETLLPIQLFYASKLETLLPLGVSLVWLAAAAGPMAANQRHVATAICSCLGPLCQHEMRQLGVI